MNESKSGDDSLHDWFAQNSADDGTPGWPQIGGKYAGKPCARQPGQKTKPKCGSSKMKRNLDKGEEEAAFRRKNSEDPNPNRKGKAKNVATEEMNLDEKCWQGYTQKGMKKKGNKVVPNCVPVGEQVKPIEIGYKDPKGRSPDQVLQDKIDRTPSLGGGQVVKYGLKKVNEVVMAEEGKKDACYKKVKSRYSIWPSAYASGALVRCRKVGADNWGNKKEEYEINEIHTSAHTPHEVPSKNLKGLVRKAVKRIDTDADGDVDNNDKAKGELGEFIPGVGNKRLYSGTMTKTARNGRGIKSVQEVFDEMYQGAAPPVKNPFIFPGGPKIPFIDTDTPTDKMDRLKRHVRKSEYLDAKSNTKKPTQVAHYEPEGEMVDEGIRMTLVKAIDKTKPGPLTRRGRIRSKLVRSEIEDAAKKNKKRRFSGLAASEKASKADKYMSAASQTTASESFDIEEGAAWTRKAGKNKEGGLNEKGRKSYERENPGSDLKAPSKKVGNPRHKSFCARMSGMKKKLTSSKTANDPNSRINKSLRAWNC